MDKESFWISGFKARVKHWTLHVPNLPLNKLNFIAKIKETLLQTVVIADQTGVKKLAKNMEMKSLLFLQVWSRKDEQMKKGYSWCSWHWITEDKFWIWFAFYYCLFLKDIRVPCPVHSCCRFLQDSFILLSLKNITRSTPQNRLLFNLLHSHCFQI